MRGIIVLATSLAVLAMSGKAQAASVVTVSPIQGHPTQLVTVTGSGFSAGEAIDVYFDTVDTLLAVSTGTGGFTVSLTMPASASPGRHYVSAVGRRAGDAAQAAVTVATPWLEGGFGAGHLGYNPYENTIGTGNVASVGSLWTTANSAAGATPAIFSAHAYIGTATGVQALSTATGAVLWTAATPGGSVDASPAVAGGVVYVGSTNGTVYAFNAATGAQIWAKTFGSTFYSSIVVVNGVLYLGGGDGNVYALQAATGSTLWSYSTGSNLVDASPAVVAGVVYIGSTNDTFYALNAASGVLIWSYTTGGSIESSPALANGAAYFGSDDGKVYAIKAGGTNKGGLLWTFTTGGPVYAAPAVANGMVFVGSADGYMYALDARTGAEIWRVTTGSLVRGAIVANQVVYFTSQNDSLYAVAASSGAILGTSVTGSTYFGSPALADGVLYVGAAGGSTYALAPLAGVDAVRAVIAAPRLSALRPDRSLLVGQ